METIKEKVTSRKLAVAIAAMLLVGASMFSGALDMKEGVDAILELAFAYIAGQGLVDVTKALGPVLGKVSVKEELK